MELRSTEDEDENSADMAKMEALANELSQSHEPALARHDDGEENRALNAMLGSSARRLIGATATADLDGIADRQVDEHLARAIRLPRGPLVAVERGAALERAVHEHRATSVTHCVEIAVPGVALWSGRERRGGKLSAW